MKKIKCDVCRKRVIPQRERTVKCHFETTDTDIYFDAMDCPNCGCQITLQVRDMVVATVYQG